MALLAIIIMGKTIAPSLLYILYGEVIAQMCPIHKRHLATAIRNILKDSTWKLIDLACIFVSA